MDKLFIVIPAYNEEENIRQVVEDWYPVVEKHNGGGESRLVIIDDGSKKGNVPSTIVRIEEDGSVTMVREGAVKL